MSATENTEPRHPATDEEYVSRNGLVCPACGYEHASSTGHVQFDVPGALFEDNHCPSCGATWTAQYRLVGYIDLTVPAPSDM